MKKTVNSIIVSAVVLAIIALYVVKCCIFAMILKKWLCVPSPWNVILTIIFVIIDMIIWLRMLFKSDSQLEQDKTDSS